MPATTYRMEEAILSQPEEIKNAVRANVEKSRTLKDKFTGRFDGRIYLVGTGTSFHAAEISSYFFRHHVPSSLPLPFTSFEFVNYTPPLTARDTCIVISHRGYKRYSAQSLHIAREKGATVIAVTGIGSTIEEGDADMVFRTVRQETSSAHTVSFTTALAVLLQLATALSENGGGGHHATGLADSVAEAIKKVLDSRKKMEGMLDTLRISDASRIWI